ncbi:MAG: exodeoxyribonuclease VII small subunit [Eubacteriales bacterium]|nr:exodeoxyribonuclease VII small subunit [Eubacteriales bacterium]
MTAKKKNTEPTFEEELVRLEELAEKMEQGELPLDELMNAYEEGSKLSKSLSERLNRAKARLNEVKAGKNGEAEVAAGSAAAQSSLLDGLDEE